MAERVLWNGEALNLNIGRQIIFDQASFSIAESEKVALVGRNGCGKTTLLRVIAGKEQVSSGKISMARNLRIFMMPQEFDVPRDIRVRDIVRQGLKYYEDLIRQYETLSPRSAEYETVQHLLQMHDAWNLETRLNTMLGRLHLSSGMEDASFSSLSGGEQRRVMLARCLIAEPDLLLLDEPTNHLDTDTVHWMEEFLSSSRCTCLFVTHDRYFLDRVSSRIVELDHGKFYSVNGSYADFLEAKAAREYREDVLEQKRRAFLRKEIEWVRRSPKARLKKNLGREKRFYEIAAQSAPERTGEVELIIPEPSRLGNKVVALKDVSLSLGGKTLFSHFSYEFTAGAKVGIVGENGCGKTSLLKLITGSLKPDSGTVEVADTVTFNYVDQGRMKLNPELTVLEEIGENKDFVSLGTEKISVWGYLKRFLFEDERINTQVKYLSGGEKARLILAKILRHGGNFLILDEPTNDLDLSSLRILEEALIAYKSSLIVVSHDRYFLNRVCNCIIGFENTESPVISLGDYDTYLEKRRSRKQSAAQEKESARKAEEAR